MNRWKIKYNDLLNVTVLQQFYENNVCGKYTVEPTPDILFVPAAETQLLMKRLDLIFKSAPQKGGFTIAAATNEKLGVNYLNFYPRKGDKLTVFIVLKNPAFLNYSEVPTTNDPNTIFYFTNNITGNPAARNVPLYITAANTGIAGNTDRIKVSRSSYSYHHPTSVVTAKIKHLLTNQELPASSINNLGGTAGSDLVFNLRALPLGKCKLTVDGSDVETFYYGGDDMPEQLYGVMEFDMSDLLAANYRLAETDHSLVLPAPLYYVQYKNRLTKWRYTFKLTAASPLFIEMAELVLPDTRANFLARLKIVCNDVGITFTQSSPDDNTIIFESVNALPLQEKYVVLPGTDRLKLTLTKYTGVPMRELAVKENLPYPSISIIDARNTLLIFSDIFLTL